MVYLLFQLGSEDALSSAGSDNATMHNNNLHGHTNNQQQHHHSTEERIAGLEREVAHWRTQFELIKLQQNFAATTVPQQPQSPNSITMGDAGCSCTTTAAALNIKPSFLESKRYKNCIFLIET